MLSQLLVIVSDRSYGRQKLNGQRPNLPYPQRTTIIKHCRPWSVNRKNSQNVNELFNPVMLVYPLGHVLSYFSQNCDGNRWLRHQIRQLMQCFASLCWYTFQLTLIFFAELWRKPSTNTMFCIVYLFDICIGSSPKFCWVNILSGSKATK